MTRREALLFSIGLPAVAQTRKTVHHKTAAVVPSGPVRWTPHPVFPGAPILFRSKTVSGTATWLEKTIEFRRDGEEFSALAGVDLDRGVGTYPLTFGDQHVDVVVSPHAYRSSTITVPDKFVEPPKEVQTRIDEEIAFRKRVFAASSVERLWRGPFTAPTATRFTSSFGVRRVYNGKTKSVHQGLDYAAAMGTEVHAANAGRVVIARDMYFEGGLVTIDHGESLFTLYMHLSKFLVKEGDAVEKGAPLAQSGSSGRVTGPHLHFAVRWQGIYLEPSTLLRLW